jgi:hypothetical protein
LFKTQNGNNYQGMSFILCGEISSMPHEAKVRYAQGVQTRFPLQVLSASGGSGLSTAIGAIEENEEFIATFL